MVVQNPFATLVEFKHKSCQTLACRCGGEPSVLDLGVNLARCRLLLPSTPCLLRRESVRYLEELARHGVFPGPLLGPRFRLRLTRKWGCRNQKMTPCYRTGRAARVRPPL